MNRGEQIARGCARFQHVPMRIDRFTQKMQEGLQAAQDLASKLGHAEIDNEHLLAALLEQSDGIARPLFDKIGVPPRIIEEKLRAELDPRAKGHAGQLSPGRQMPKWFNG